MPHFRQMIPSFTVALSLLAAAAPLSAGDAKLTATLKGHTDEVYSYLLPRGKMFFRSYLGSGDRQRKVRSA